MKLHEPKPSLDQQMMSRYCEMLSAHPDAPLTITTKGTPPIEGTTNMTRVLRGELTHVLWKRGPLLLVSWIPSHSTQWMFDAYSE